MTVDRFFKLNKTRFPAEFKALFGAEKAVEKAEEPLKFEDVPQDVLDAEFNVEPGAVEAGKIEPDAVELVKHEAEPGAIETATIAAPAEEVVDVPETPAKAIDKMTKAEIRAHILKEYGVEADDRMNKARLLTYIDELEAAIKNINV